MGVVAIAMATGDNKQVWSVEWLVARIIQVLTITVIFVNRNAFGYVNGRSKGVSLQPVDTAVI